MGDKETQLREGCMVRTQHANSCWHMGLAGCRSPRESCRVLGMSAVEGAGFGRISQSRVIQNSARGMRLEIGTGPSPKGMEQSSRNALGRRTP